MTDWLKRLFGVKEADEWKQRHDQQQLQNLKLRDQLLRTERELHGVLQKKYDIMQAAKREERHRIREEQQLARHAQRKIRREHPPPLTSAS